MPCVLFGGAPNNSLTDSGFIQGSLVFPYFMPTPMYVGKPVEFGDGDGVNRTATRYLIEAKTKPMPRSATTALKDFGQGLRIVERVLAMEHTWIIKVYEADILSGPPAFRSVYDRSDSAVEISTDHFWYYGADRSDGYPFDTDSGTLPMKIQVLDQPSWDSLSGGTIALTMHFKSCTIYRSHS